METSMENGAVQRTGLRDNVGRPYVTDTRTGTVAVFMADNGGMAYVRPVHGGPEWEVEGARLRRATAAEIQAAQ